MVADLSRSIRAVTREFHIRPQPRYSPGLPLGHLFPTMARRLTMTNCVCALINYSLAKNFFVSSGKKPVRMKLIPFIVSFGRKISRQMEYRAD